jgi:hypothetical protein
MHSLILLRGRVAEDTNLAPLIDVRACGGECFSLSLSSARRIKDPLSFPPIVPVFFDGDKYSYF